MFDNGPSTVDLEKNLYKLYEIVADLQRRIYQLEQLETGIDDGK